MSTAASARRPGAVTASYVIWLIGAILSLIGAIFALFVGILALTGGAVFGGIAGAAVGSVILIFSIFVFVVAIIELVIVNRMRDGRNWARVTLTVLGILSLLGTVLPWFTGGWSSSSSWNFVGIVVLLLAIILMYVPGANAYFRASTPVPASAYSAPAAPYTTAMPVTPEQRAAGTTTTEPPAQRPDDGRPPVS